MTFLQAVRLGFRRAFTVRGRAAISEFWWWMLFVVIVACVSLGLDAVLEWQIRGEGLITTATYFALIIPTTTLAVRRWHDLGHSGWWILMSLVPCVGGAAELVWLSQPGDEATNRFGPPPRAAQATSFGTPDNA
ncbi:MAG: DUF805 domain-containing protein [Candidatus Nanopelagicales bacterium]